MNISWYQIFEITVSGDPVVIPVFAARDEDLSVQARSWLT